MNADDVRRMRRRDEALIDFVTRSGHVCLLHRYIDRPDLLVLVRGLKRSRHSVPYHRRGLNYISSIGGSTILRRGCVRTVYVAGKGMGRRLSRYVDTL